MRSNTNWNGPKVWANRHLGSVDPHSKSAEWLSWVPGPHLSFGPIWTHFMRIFELGIAPRSVFNLYSKN